MLFICLSHFEKKEVVIENVTLSSLILKTNCRMRWKKESKIHEKMCSSVI